LPLTALERDFRAQDFEQYFFAELYLRQLFFGYVRLLGACLEFCSRIRCRLGAACCRLRIRRLFQAGAGRQQRGERDDG
jgi:hypothetical protein